MPPREKTYKVSGFLGGYWKTEIYDPELNIYAEAEAYYEQEARDKAWEKYYEKRYRYQKGD